MRFSVVLFLFSICVFGIKAQRVETLDQWEFLKSDLGGIWEGVRHAPKGSQEAVPVWEEVDVPHCYNANDAVNPYKNYYQGPSWYRTFVDFSPIDAKTILLYFEGVGQKADVFVFNQKVGSHVGGYDEWSIDITQAVRKNIGNDYLNEHYDGKIPILIRADNSRDVEMIPSDLSDFNLYGGIYRPVYLKYLPATYIDRIQLTPQLNENLDKGSLDVNIQINGTDDTDYQLSVNLLSPAGKVIGHKEIRGAHPNPKVQFEVSQPLLWAPSSPSLYSVEVSVISGNKTHSVKAVNGFRKFEFMENGPFKLNNERLLIRGTHRHEDHAGTGAAMSRSVLKREMKLMKEMGVNFIRLAHYQQSSDVLELCDSLGFLVWEEIPWCRGGLGGEIYKDQARRMLKNMITQHYNHPSVIIWGLGNENDWPGDFVHFREDSIRSFMKELNGLAHGLDNTRKTGIRRCDFCKDIVDVYSPSIWAGWYRGKFTEYLDVSKEWNDKVDHFLHMEWGASHHSLRHSENPEKDLENIVAGKGVDERDGDATLYGGPARVSKDGDWTTTYACNLIDWHLKEQEKMGWLSGTAYWPFKDFSTPVRPENPIPYVNQKGVVERDLTLKESYYVFQSYWTDSLMAHIYGSTWPVRWGDEGEKKLVKVYSNCEGAELFLNGESMGVKKRVTENYPAAGLHWNVVFETGENQLSVIATKGDKSVKDELTLYYETRQWGTPQKIDFSQDQVESGVTEIEVVVRDENGVICLDAKNWVEFDYVGTGKMLADMGTSNGSRKIQLANGRAFIRVQQKEGIGVLKVAIENLEPKLISINNK
ncbi:glycoside hydrolase family 2 protein [Marinilabilia salmonicolor]|uniref:glycoside hydrolase family 2 protein n=1 Tax=Marinilabilia salmonicolor TaxID=989 RepID=UPI000299FA13|nr:glycoside hydrolase family 2 TIM barrel-domain containing protein [Marinilabilia salmonicolor]